MSYPNTHRATHFPHQPPQNPLPRFEDAVNEELNLKHFTGPEPTTAFILDRYQQGDLASEAARRWMAENPEGEVEDEEENED